MVAISLGDAALAAVGGLRFRRSPARSGAPHPTGARVLRDSIEAGTFEEVFFKAHPKGETDKILRAAKALCSNRPSIRARIEHEDRTATAVERSILQLTRNAVAVLEALLTIARVQAGRVYPSYDRLAADTGLGRATVARVLPVLEDIGFIIRQRRFKRVAAEGPGPRYEQTSNAYRTFLPQSVLAFLPRWMKPAPLPADVEQYEADRIEDTKAMFATLTCKELAQAMVGGALGKALARVGAHIDRHQREYQCDAQPLLDSYNHRPKGVRLNGEHVSA